jgi:hypothetical protein
VLASPPMLTASEGPGCGSDTLRRCLCSAQQKPGGNEGALAVQQQPQQSQKSGRSMQDISGCGYVT